MTHRGLFRPRTFCDSVKTLLLGSTAAHTGSPGLPVAAARTPGSAAQARWRSPGLQPKALGSQPVCVAACTVGADRASSAAVCAHQITPLQRLRVGKEHPAKHRCPEARRLPTCNASRGPCRLSWPSFHLLQRLLPSPAWSWSHCPLLHTALIACRPPVKDLSCCSPRGDPASC